MRLPGRGEIWGGGTGWVVLGLLQLRHLKLLNVLPRGDPLGVSAGERGSPAWLPGCRWGPCACRGVGFSFIFSWLLMLVVLLTFLLGGNTYMLVCESWRSQQLFQVGCPRPATSAAPFGMLSPAVPPCTVPTVLVSSALSSWIPPDSYLASTCRRRWATRAAP